MSLNSYQLALNLVHAVEHVIKDNHVVDSHKMRTLTEVSQVFNSS